MAFEEALQPITLPASGDLSASLYCWMKINASGQIALPAANGVDAAVILQDEPKAAGRAARVAHGGVSKIKLGATLAAGADITCDAAGKAIAAGANTKLGTLIIGGANNQVGTVLIDKR